MHKVKKVVFKKIVEEMHKKMLISSLFFCIFALKYKLGCFCAENKRYIICESCIEHNVQVMKEKVFTKRGVTEKKKKGSG